MTVHGWNTSASSSLRGGSRGASSRPTNPNLPNQAKSAVDTTVDPFLLDFGTSVNVNEDLRQVIRGEIQEIEESITFITGENKKEETVERQLRQDLCHSHSELTNLSRCATDQLETVQVHSTFLRGLENTLHVDLVASSGVRGAPAGVTKSSKETSNNDSGTVDSKEPATESYKVIIQHREDKFQKITATMKATAKEVDELFEKHRTMTESTKAIEHRIKSEKLDTILQEKKGEGDRLEEELQQEKDKLHAIKLATHKKRNESGSNAQQLADLTKESDAARRQAEAEQGELTTQLSTVTELENKGYDEIKVLESELDKIKAGLQEMTDQKRLIEDNAEAQAELEEQQKRKEELLLLKEEVAAKLEASKSKVEASGQEVAKAKELEAEALKLKAENDKKHNEILVPGRVELAEISEKKEKLAKLIEDTQRNNSELQLSEKDELESKLESKKLVMEELAGLQEEAKALKAKKTTMDVENAQAKEAWEREIQEHVELEKKWRRATEVKEAQLKNIREEQEKRCKEKIEEATRLANEDRAKGERLVHILKHGVDLMDKYQKKMEKLGESPRL